MSPSHRLLKRSFVLSYTHLSLRPRPTNLVERTCLPKVLHTDPLEDLAIHLQYQTDILVLPDSLQKTQRKLQGLRRTLKLARKMLYMWPQAIYNQSSPMESLPGFYHNYFSRLTGRNGEMRLFKELIEAANKKGFRGLIISGFPGV